MQSNVLTRRRLLILAITPILAGCIGSTGSTQQATKQEQNPAKGAVGDTKAPATIQPAAATAVPPPPTAAPPTAAPAKPTPPPPTPKPQPTPTPAPVALKLLNKGYGQPADSTQVAYAFVVENPNPGLSVEATAYQVAFYNEAGTVMKAESGYVSLILPGQTLGHAGSAHFSDKARPARADFQIKPGTFKPAEQLPTFTTEGVTYRAERFGSKVVGIVKSPYKQDAKTVEVHVVTYDAAGAINGGGVTFLQFVPAGGQSAAEVSVYTASAPAKVEMYAAVSSITAFG